MPILNVMDNIRTLNLELDASRGPLRGYRQSLRALEEIRGHLELTRFIEPPTLLIQETENEMFVIVYREHVSFNKKRGNL